MFIPFTGSFELISIFVVNTLYAPLAKHIFPTLSQVHGASLQVCSGWFGGNWGYDCFGCWLDEGMMIV